MKGILTNFGKFTKKENPPDKPQVRYGRTEFLKVVFSLDVFSTFLGQLRTECKFSGAGRAREGDRGRAYPQKGGGGVYIYKE